MGGLEVIAAEQDAPRASGAVFLKSGARVDYRSAKVEGNAVVVRTAYGELRYPKALLSERSAAEFFPSPAASKPAPIAPAPSASAQPPSSRPPSIKAGATAATAALPASQQVKEGSFKLPVDVYGAKEVEILYRIPLDASGRPGAAAHNIVFYAPYFCQRKFFDTPYLPEFSEKLGLTLFTFSHPMKMDDASDPTRSYAYAESGWFEVVFRAQQELQRRYRLPPRKLLVLGDSLGATMAANMAVRHPERIDAAAFTGAGNLPKATAASGVAWCILTTRGQENTPEVRAFAQQRRDAGAPVIYAETPPNWPQRGKTHFYHSAGPLAKKLLQDFISAVAALRDSSGRLTPAVQWPLLASVQEPGHILPNTPETREKVPASETIFMPSPAFAASWREIPPKAQPLALASGGMMLQGLIAHPLPAAKPKGVLVYFHPWNHLSRYTITDNLYFFAENGYVAVAVEYGQETATEQARALIAWTATQEQLEGVPVYVAGYGDGASLAIRAACEGAAVPIKAVACIGGVFDKRIAAMLPRLACPLFVIEGRDESDDVKSAAGLDGKAVIAGAARTMPAKLASVEELASRPGVTSTAALDSVVDWFGKRAR